MAIDFIKLSNDLNAIQAVSGRMSALVEVVRKGKFSIEEIDIPFSPGQQALLVNRYQVLKAKLVSLVQGLP